MLNTANELSKNSMKKNSVNNYKFLLTCKEKITQNNDTTTWIELMSKIDHASIYYKIFIALLENTIPIIVKIGDTNKLQEEYTIANNLNIQKLPNFIKFYCYFTCLNNLDNIKEKTSICSTSGTQQGIIVMPYYKLGQIDKYNWNKDNFDILKNILKHIICSLLYAYEKYGFIHNDAHLGNILLKESKKETITYNYDIKLPVMSILPVIMDFDKSNVINNTNNINGAKPVYVDIIRIFDLISAELDIQTDITDKKYLLDNYRSQNTPISKDVYDSLLNIIDTIVIKFRKSDYIIKR
jgi:hypothetical protein